ncbi:MAG: hypothetical protein LBT31_06740 [Synergistaceae bacterium]|jgi:hypothetical protein|nr:hypothetical protein [Synergistaceae bacterium]
MPEKSVGGKSFDIKKSDDAIRWIVENWKENKSVATLASQMEILGKNMATLRSASDTESKKKMRIVWQKAAQHFWDLLWSIVEAKIDAGPPEELVFTDAERLFIDFGHLSSQYTTPNPAFEVQIAEPSAVDMYQYNRLTDYLKENYALIFGKTYNGPSGGVTLNEKLERFNNELKASQMRRRMAMNTLFNDTGLVDKPDLDEMLNNLENGLRDAIEVDMRTKRIREAGNKERDIIKENCKNYETSEHAFWFLMENFEKKLTQTNEPDEPAVQAESVDAAASSEHQKPEDAFDPFAEIGGSPFKKTAPPVEKEPEPAGPSCEDEDFEGSIDDQPEAVEASPRSEQIDQGESIDQSLKIIQNVMSLHDRAKFLSGLIVHVTNETERWKTRYTMARNKFKGQGVPAMKLELREGLNHKKEFMTLAGHSARVDISPLCQNKSVPISSQRAGEIMMDLTPLDPDMLRASRIRMFGIPRVILVPGQGFGVYDWEDNSLIIPIFPAVSDVKDICFALASFRWDNDEDRSIKDTYSLLKQNKGKGIRALQEAFFSDYFLWISKERKGYRVLPREVSKWFKTFFKQKSGAATDSKPNAGQRR